MKMVRLSVKILSGSILIWLLAFGMALGWGESSPRAVAMGGAYTALARNIEAPYWNPANLGLTDNNRFSINLFNVGAGVKNNSFSLSEYNKYNGKFLTDGDKEDILNSIPADGLSLDLLAEVSALNFSVGNFAVTCKGYAASSMNLDRDPVELLLYGNAVMREVSLSNSQSEGYGIADASLSYGRAIQKWQGGELAVGASIHYLRGIAYQKILESEGGVATTDTGFVGSGRLLMRTAMGGSGFASDLGLSVRFEDSWYFSATWQNVYSKLVWNNETEEMLFTFDMQPVTIDAMADSVESDSLVSSNDTTYSVDSFGSDLPSVIKLGLAKEYHNMIWSVDWVQGFANRPGQGVNPSVCAGFEYKPLSFLPLRTGFGFGGDQGTIYSFGFGLHFKPFNFDLGLASSGSPLPSHTRGARAAVGMGLYF
jgi:hypothetical protein